MSNKPSRRPLFVLVLIFFLGIGSFMSVELYQLGKEYKHEMTRVVELLNFEERLLNGREWLLGNFEAQDRLDAANLHLTKANLLLQTSYFHSAVFVAAGLVFLIVVFVAFRKEIHGARMFSSALVAVAFLCLFVGISLPMLEIGAFSLDLTIPLKGELPYVGIKYDLSKEFSGRMYYYYQNKSIIELIGILFESKNFIVAIAILGFSIIMPLLKLLLSLWLVMSREARRSVFLVKFVGKIGKWSMADVFVAACFLAYLSFYNMNTGIDTESHTLPGLYFFLGYCVISIASSMYIDKAIKAETDFENEQARLAAHS